MEIPLVDVSGTISDVFQKHTLVLPHGKDAPPDPESGSLGRKPISGSHLSIYL